MNYQEEFMSNVKDVQECDWLLKMCETAIVENDTAFIHAFNHRCKRFKYLFIEE